MFRPSSCCVLVVFSAVATHALDTGEVNEKLSEGVSVAAVDPSDWLAQCVPPFQEAGFIQNIPYSNHYLIEEPAGLCADFLACAYEQCILPPEGIAALNSTDTSTGTTDYDDLNQDDLPPLNLPSHISFPKNTKDIVEMVKFAGANCMTVSIKNGGHSYAGSSTMKGSLQFNLRDLQKYSGSSITPCTGDILSNACQRAIANGKTAVVRVGGGELWDNVYRSVLEWNNNQGDDSTKYDVVGGAAGTVSSVGGWLQGGGESIGDERMYGFGVDQVMEIQMVLAEGSHVVFGPTVWEDSEGMLYPKTTMVEGKCNQNVDEDESEWIWGDCPEGSKIPFDKLWKAVRGGGGGTYGVVTSIYYQLHAFRPLSRIIPDPAIGFALLGLCGSQGNCPEAFKAITFFFVDLFFDPAAIGVDEDTSNSCGSPAFVFDVARFSVLYCRNPQAVMDAWQRFSDALQPAFGDAVADVMSELLVMDSIGSYPEAALSDGTGFAPQGRIGDLPPPSTQSDVSPCWSVLVPKEFILLKSDDIFNFLIYLPDSHVIGGQAAIADDSTTAVPLLQRQAGLQSCVYDRETERLARFGFSFFQPEAEDGAFLGGTEYNHISNVLFGPLKTDFTEPCPTDISTEEQEELCVSLVESVWGTKLLAELEATKKEVDPNNMFKCYRCVGEKNDGSCEIQPPGDDDDDDDDSLSPTGSKGQMMKGEKIGKAKGEKEGKMKSKKSGQMMGKVRG